MSNKKRYWKGLEDLNNSPSFIKSVQQEFAEEVPAENFLAKENLDQTSTPRRDFLKFLGFSVTAASLAACETPVRNVIPYVFKPEEINPGIASWYASTYSDGNDFCSVLVKTREGRPIKIEGNKYSSITKGGTNARVQASVLSLYDSARLAGPTASGTATTWDAVDKAIGAKLEGIVKAGGNIRVLTSSITSPSTKKIVGEFAAKYANVKHISYDAVSYSAIIKANQESFGTSAVPTYMFDKANVIVGFGADFLANWVSPIEFAKQYSKNRKVNKENAKMSRHFQFESTLSITGSNADVREGIKPSQLPVAIVNLYNSIAKLAGKSGVSSKAIDADKQIAIAAKELWENKGKSLVVCGVNDIASQLFVNAINSMLNNYGATINLDIPDNTKQGEDAEVTSLIEEMKGGKVAALFMYNVNPVYSLPASLGFAEALKKVSLSVSFADRADETASLAQFICPDHHYLESWGDANPRKGHYALIQPTIFPLFNTRSFQESMLKWSGNNTNYQAYVKNYWRNNIFPLQSAEMFFENFWMKSLHDGIIELPPDAKPSQKMMAAAADTAIAATVAGVDSTVVVDEKKGPIQKVVDELKEAVGIESKEEKGETAAKDVAMASAVVSFNTNSFGKDLSGAAGTISKAGSSAGAFEITLYEKIGMGNGNQANNPWLLEMPDPVSKVTWDNYITMSPKQMQELGLETFLEKEVDVDKVEVTVNGVKLTAPVYPQPGQPYGTIGLALGYGRTAAGKAANGVGQNAFQFVSIANGTMMYTSYNAQVSASVGKHALAATQTHHTIMGRKIVKETTLEEYKKDPAAGNEKEYLSIKNGHEHTKVLAEDVDLWATKENPGFDKPGLFWNMSIDLNSCIGCGNCVVSCQAENNVAVVGKDQVRLSREMHWIRIDRYYSSDVKNQEQASEQGLGLIAGYKAMEVPSENPQVVFQPMLCQHCNHAPCETVCPVIATTHSNEGLNQMTYNRCLGTKYCANNCPYKVRRFNWYRFTENSAFDFNMNDTLGKMVLNPDVTVRTRGVMEKCSMCIQRIQEGKLNAKKDGRRIKDGEVQTACAQSCPTDAITFGNVNDKESKIAKIKEDERMYHVLAELDIKPSVFYLTKVRNADEKAEA